MGPERPFQNNGGRLNRGYRQDCSDARGSGSYRSSLGSLPLSLRAYPGCIRCSMFLGGGSSLTTCPSRFPPGQKLSQAEPHKVWSILLTEGRPHIASDCHAGSIRCGVLALCGPYSSLAGVVVWPSSPKRSELIEIAFFGESSGVGGCVAREWSEDRQFQSEVRI